MKIMIDATEVAPLIGFTSSDAFLRARDRLERDEAFPLPVPTCLRPLKWRRDAVQAWVAAQGLPAQQMPDRDELRQRGVTLLMEEARRA